MSVIDILFRVDTICKKYDKYDIEKQRSFNNASSGDAFGRLSTSFESQIDATIHKSEAAALETNRAAAVAMNAEVRRMKARLLEEVPKLQKLARKKVKGLSNQEIETRHDLVLALQDRVLAIPEGATTTTRQTGGWAASSSFKHIQFDHDEDYNSHYFAQTEESSGFRNEYEMRKLKQDEGLDVISEGLDMLKNLARDMNEELDKQIPLADEIDTKVEKATVDLKNNNIRLKETLYGIRSSQNFCIDIILVCIILGIAAYLYKILT